MGQDNGMYIMAPQPIKKPSRRCLVCPTELRLSQVSVYTSIPQLIVPRG